MNLRVKFVLSIVLPGLLCLMLPGSIRADTVNINSVNANSSPFFVDISTTNLLAQYGITLANVTPGTTVGVLCGECGGNSIVPSSPPNLLTQVGNDNGMSYTLQFSTPLSTLSFNLAGNSKSGGSGTLVAAWSATAFDASGNVVSSVGDPSLFSTFSPFAPQPFTLTGPGIASVTFFTQCFNVCGTGLNIDDLSAPEIKIVSSLTLSLLSGNGKTGSPLSVLPNPLVVKVFDQNGTGVPGVSIAFGITQQPAGASGASITPLTATTLADGTAAAQLTLGDTLGQYQVNASCQGQTCVPNSVIFSETASSCRLDASIIAGLSHQADPPQPFFGPAGQKCSTLSFGCALMSYSNMVVSFDNPLLNDTPPVFDAEMVGVGGYVNKSGTVPGCLLDPAKVSEAVDFLVEPSGSGSFAGTLTDPALDTFVNQHFCQNDERVILKLTEFVNGSLKGDHFVLVTGRNGNDWSLFDPGWRNASPVDALGSLQGHYSGFTTTSLGTGASAFRRFVVNEARAYDTTPLADPSSLSFTAFSPVELLITDPSSRRLGRSPETGSDVFEIPKGSYYRDFPLSLDDDIGSADGDPSGIKTAYIPAPASGSYQVAITGTALGTYTVRFRSVASDRSVQETRVTAIAAIGTTASYQVVYSSTPGTAFVVSRVITFQNTLDDLNNSFQLGLIDNGGIVNSLSQKIQNAFDATGSSRTNLLDAFINEVNAQAGKHINGAGVQVLLDDAHSLIGQTAQ